MIIPEDRCALVTAADEIVGTHTGGKAIGIAGPRHPAFAREASLNPLLRLAITGLSSKVRRQARRLGVTGKFVFMDPSGAQLQTVATAVDEGILRPVVRTTFPFVQTPHALEALANGSIHGEAVITAS